MKTESYMIILVVALCWLFSPTQIFYNWTIWQGGFALIMITFTGSAIIVHMEFEHGKN